MHSVNCFYDLIPGPFISSRSRSLGRASCKSNADFYGLEFGLIKCRKDYQRLPVVLLVIYDEGVATCRLILISMSRRRAPAPEEGERWHLSPAERVCHSFTVLDLHSPHSHSHMSVYISLLISFDLLPF